jgi:hypothetical protein|mmetsp:Transcript_27832/g.50587  ORF Transcript_27832/g.50587 Transcript_27832/m.50587 type:complete len:106 (+) Transcript_27832:910-1227(+)
MGRKRTTTCTDAIASGSNIGKWLSFIAEFTVSPSERTLICDGTGLKSNDEYERARGEEQERGEVQARGEVQGEELVCRVVLCIKETKGLPAVVSSAETVCSTNLV